MNKEWDPETAHLTDGAGIVLLRRFENEWRVLGLWMNGGYDITKGHVESGDDHLDTAIRETFEEAGIDELKFEFGSVYHTEDFLRTYIATTTQDAVIKPNQNGLEEHESCCWLTFEQMEKQAYDYLKPIIIWAHNIARKGENNDQVSR